MNWLAGPLSERWGYTVVGGFHAQQRSDLDADGWTDLPMYRRVVGRPRLFWDNGAGQSLLLALGGMGEERRGGTTPGRTAPDGRIHAENLDTRRFDGGAVWRMTTGRGHVLAVRGSATVQHHTHAFGPVVEEDSHRTLFGEVSLTGTRNRHTWVAGAALNADRYRARDVPRFDYTHRVPAVFGQDEFRVTRTLTLSGSARVDVHNVFGTFASPRVSALVRPNRAWTIRVSTGRGGLCADAVHGGNRGDGVDPCGNTRERARRAR